MESNIGSMIIGNIYVMDYRYVNRRVLFKLKGIEGNTMTVDILDDKILFFDVPIVFDITCRNANSSEIGLFNAYMWRHNSMLIEQPIITANQLKSGPITLSDSLNVKYVKVKSHQEGIDDKVFNTYIKGTRFHGFAKSNNAIIFEVVDKKSIDEISHFVYEMDPAADVRIINSDEATFYLTTE